MRKTKIAATGSCPICGKEFYTNYRKAVARHMRNHPEVVKEGRKRFTAFPVADWNYVLLRDIMQLQLQPQPQSQVVDNIQIDLINHPPHYTYGKYEVIDVLQDWFPTNPLLWQVVRYCARADHKGNPVQDLEKAKFYLEHEIARRKEATTTNDQA